MIRTALIAAALALLATPALAQGTTLPFDYEVNNPCDGGVDIPGYCDGGNPNPSDTADSAAPYSPSIAGQNGYGAPITTQPGPEVLQGWGLGVRPY